MLAHSGPIYSQSREACCIRCLNKLLRVVVKTPWTIYVVRRVSQPFCSLSFVLRITSSKRPANGIHTLNRVCSCVGMLGTRYLFDCHHSMRKNAPLSPPSVVCCSWCVFYSPPRYQKLLVAHSSLQQTQEWRISAGIDPKDKSTTGGCVSTPRTTALSLSASFRASQSKTHTRKVDGTRKKKRKINFFFPVYNYRRRPTQGN